MARVWTDELIEQYMGKMYGVDEPQGPKPKRKAVEAQYPDGTVKRYCSISVAAIRTGISKGQICECCNHGRVKAAHGIKWKFI